MHCLPRYLPFQDWDEWITVKDGLYSHEPANRGHAVQLVEVWRSRGKVPHSVDSTAQMVEIGLSSSGWRSDMELRLLYTTAITRAINGLADNKQQGEHAEAVSKIASTLGIPGWIVGVRHDGTHNELPSLPVLRVAATTMLSWFQDNYWTLQYDLLLQLSNICIPPSLQQSKASVLIPNATLDNPVLSFDSCLEKSSSSFVTDSFVPVFVAGCIKIPLKNSDQVILGSQSSLARKTVEKQKKHWLHYLTKVLTARSTNMHTLLCQLLATLVEVGSVVVSSSIDDGESANEAFELTQWHVELSLLWINEVIVLIHQIHGLSTSGKHQSGSALVRSSSSASLNGVNISSNKLSASDLASQMSLFYSLVDTVVIQLQAVLSSRFSGSFLSQCSNKLIVDSVNSICDSVRSMYLNSMTEADRRAVQMGAAAVSGDKIEEAETDDSVAAGTSATAAGGEALNEMESFLAGLSNGKGKIGGGPNKKKQKTTIDNNSSSNTTSIAAAGVVSSSALPTVRYASLSTASSVRSACGEGGVRVCSDYPVWPLGVLPGQTGSSHLLDLELLDSR